MYPWEISYLDLTNTDSLKIPPTVTGQDGKWRHWKRYASDVNWCWCWCCWRCRRPGGSFKMFQVTVSHLWIDAEVLQMPGDWSQYCSHPFKYAFQMEPPASSDPASYMYVYMCMCRGSLSAVSPFPSSSSPSSSPPPAAMGSKCDLPHPHSLEPLKHDLIKISVCGRTNLLVTGRRPLQPWLERLKRPAHCTMCTLYSRIPL